MSIISCGHTSCHPCLGPQGRRTGRQAELLHPGDNVSRVGIIMLELPDIGLDVPFQKPVDASQDDFLCLAALVLRYGGIHLIHRIFSRARETVGDGTRIGLLVERGGCCLFDPAAAAGATSILPKNDVSTGTTPPCDFHCARR